LLLPILFVFCRECSWVQMLINTFCTLQCISQASMHVRYISVYAVELHYKVNYTTRLLAVAMSNCVICSLFVSRLYSFFSGFQCES
jgi:hypothetical protein